MSPALVLCLALGTTPAPIEQPTSDRRLSLTAAYVAEELVHPGGQLGLEYALFRRSWLSFIAGANLGGFVHPRYVATLSFTGVLGVRATTPSGFLVDLTGELGYLHLFPDGAVYQVPDDGTPRQVPNLGRPAFRAGGTLGLGFDFSRPLKLPLTVVLRVGAFGETRFSYGVILHPQVLLSVSWAVW